MRHLQPLVGHVLTNEYIKHHLTSIHSDRAVKEEITAGILFSFFFFFYNYKAIYVLKGDPNLLALKLLSCISE